MNRKKLIISLSIIGVVAAIAIGGTIAYFQDVETSVGNKFVAGKFNLKIDNTCHYNGKVCANGKWGNTQEPCACTWAEKDLAGELYFNLLDVKPGDNGEDTISLHVINNDAWMCAEVANLASDDNGCEKPESDIDKTCGAGQGELKDNLFFTIWKDTDCDNVLDGEVPPVAGYCDGDFPCPIYDQPSCDPGQGCGWDSGTPGQPGEQVLVQNQTAMAGFWPIADSSNGTPLNGNQTYCLGVKWNVPIETSNIIQTDSLIGDVKFTAVQSRNMPNYVCTPGGGCVPQTEICDGKDNDCDGTVDEGCNPAIETICNDGIDNDGDMAIDCEDSDCVNDPSCASALCGDGICNAGENEQNCPADCAVDMDGDGFTVAQGDCNDSNPSMYPGAPELCNGLDDDCNGTADNGNPGSGGGCNTGLQGACAAGTLQCQGGSLQCVQNLQPAAETCNGKDDDCDGMVDENDPGGGGACNTGLMGVCAAGTRHCAGGSLSCVQNVIPVTEICGNGLDDDCDGAVDEDCLCSPGCYPNWIGDGYCDQVCNNAACSWDGGDCGCSPGCTPSWIGDGYCDSACNNEACSWDGGDCGCNPSCNPTWIGDGYCDQVCNNAACSWDGSDCI